MYFLRYTSVLAIVLKANSVIPPPPPECNDQNIQNEKPKFYHEPCSNDTECFGSPVSMVCTNGKCQCAEYYVPEERFTGENSIQTVCVPAPSLLNKCNTTCQKPAICLPYTGEGGDNHTKVCQCGQPYHYEDGVCYLDCQKDEYYDTSKFRCIKRCKKNEVRVNETCFPLADIGEKCQIDPQCETPYSECRSNACKCERGFHPKNSICYPSTVSCPNGEALRENREFVPCHLQDQDSPSQKSKEKLRPPPPPPPRGSNSNCPKGYYCMIVPGDYYNARGSGFCCPVHPNACPVGLPHRTAKCGAVSPQDETCPWETHFCQSQTAASGDESKQLCCPKSCSSNFVQVGNKCLPRVHLGDACYSKQQCMEGYSECVKGVCKCQANAVQRGNALYHYCEIQCKDDEIVYKDKCQKRLKLAEICTPTESYFCPEYAMCSSKNHCVCQCGAFTLADNVCAPPPICHPPRFPIPFDAAGGKQSSTLPPIPRISDEERDKLLQNTTFCKVRGKSPPAGVNFTKKCPEKQYCSYYISSLGICCPKPEPFCPFGGTPLNNSICDPKNPLSCGVDNTCVKYLQPVDGDANSKDYTVCCKKSFWRPEPLAAGQK